MRRSTAAFMVVAIVAALTGFPVPAQEASPGPVEGQASSAAPAHERVSRLQGRAYLGRHRDVVGATVLARPMDDPSRVYLTSTDGKGVFRIGGLPDGSYEVRIEREGLQEVRKEDVEVRFPFRAVVELLMEPVVRLEARPAGLAVERNGTRETVSVEGTVRNVAQEPFQEAQLRLVRADGGADPRMLRTAADGTFGFDGLATGPWLLSVRGVGMLPIRTRLVLTEDTELRITLVRQPAGYEPSPLELMPPEEPVPPPVFAERQAPAPPTDADGVARRRVD